MMTLPLTICSVSLAVQFSCADQSEGGRQTVGISCACGQELAL